MSTDDRRYDRLYVAILTPYKQDGSLDKAALRKFLQYFTQPKFLDAGGGMIINSEAGELFYLSREEKRRNAEIEMEECGGKMPVFAGVADLTTKDGGFHQNETATLLLIWKWCWTSTSSHSIKDSL